MENNLQPYQQPYQQPYPPSYQPQVYGPPPEIKRWNWGAFMFNIWWGIGNKAYLTLLCLIPLFNIIWFFVCGAKGNEWAWQAGGYTDIYLFLKTQESWNRAGKIAFLLSLLAAVLLVFLLVLIGGMLVGSAGYYGYGHYWH